MPAPPSAHTDPPPPDRAGAGWLSTLGWACYLACSWTWCIGMFLPVLLVRDYGIWGFVVFAVPNVLGAAAMGWVLRERSASRALVHRHRPAMVLFSLVTIAFQIFFVGYLGSFEGTLAIGAVLPAGLVLALVMWLVPRRSGVLRLAAWAVGGFSLVAFAIYVRRGGIEPPVSLESQRAAWIAPVSAFGFLLCPYLDRTFHRVRLESSDSEARATFTVGFGVVFTCMILFTLAYAPWMIAFDAARGRERIVDDPHSIVLAHILLQLFFTVGAHAGESAARSRAGSIALLAGALVLALAMPASARIIGAFGGPADRESVYRLFMAFYGLVFPAYVWLCMIPTRDGHSGIDDTAGRRKLIAWAVAVAVAAPAFWMGFIEREEWWLGPGLGVVLLARVFIPGGAGFGRLPREPSGAPVPAPTRPPTLAAHATPEPGPGDA